MNKYALSLLAIAACAAPAFAQTTAPAQPAPAAPAASPAATPAAKAAIPTGIFYKGQGPQQYLIKSRLLGMNVLNKDGTVIGSVDDVILGTNNEVQGVVIKVGGLLGVGEKAVGVRYSALQFATKDGKRTISLPQATKEVLAALEPYQGTEARRSLLERARDKARELSDKAKDSDALKKAKEAGKTAVDKTKELGGQAVEKGKQVIDAAKEKAGTTTPAPATPKAP